MSNLTRFKSKNGYFLGELFQSGNSGYVTRFIDNNVDLGTIFMAGNSGYVTGFIDPSGKDLGSIFEQILPFTVTGPAIYGVTEADSYGNKYCYAIFTDTSSESTVTINQNNTNLTAVMVGGGGAGGSATSDSDGGGGGGGVFLATDIVRPVGYLYYINIGRGGYEGSTGGQSQIVGDGSTSLSQSFIKCEGGYSGTGTGIGLGGLCYVYDSPQDTMINGGQGGDQDNGYDSYYNNGTSNRQLAIPASIVEASPTYISTYYAGGGGGGKGNDEDKDYYGGSGGGNPEGPAGNGGNNGLGGKRSGNTNNPNYIGEDGVGYGGGGGAGGFNDNGGSDVYAAGGFGRQGIGIVFAPIIIPQSNLPFSATGAFIYRTTNNPSGLRYCYAIFTNTDPGVTKKITANIDINPGDINVIVVGGGGGGGPASDGYSPGGGGGGGVNKMMNSIILNKGSSGTIIVGAGGAGGSTNGKTPGGTGGTSQFTFDSSGEYLSCTGGTGGTYTGKGIGGDWYNGLGSGANGGDGGDGGGGSDPDTMNGQPSGFSSAASQLPVDDIMQVCNEPSYINYYYSGGGGGGKTNDDLNYHYGGNGGNRLQGMFFNGLGGLAGISGFTSYNNFPGHNGEGYGGGGGAGGFGAAGGSDFAYYGGGAGKQGIVIVYCPIRSI